ncbi:hypothetical protein L218DRAFT_966987 [Marasmius fiardii PR-910]|nr:hypothetical protein L218DRAFT_966987 [Marasmius fiardii PR-910]
MKPAFGILFPLTLTLKSTFLPSAQTEQKRHTSSGPKLGSHPLQATKSSTRETSEHGDRPAPNSTVTIPRRTVGECVGVVDLHVLFNRTSSTGYISVVTETETGVPIVRLFPVSGNGATRHVGAVGSTLGIMMGVWDGRFGCFLLKGFSELELGRGLHSEF